MTVTVLAGGVGAARFLRGLRERRRPADDHRRRQRRRRRGHRTACTSRPTSTRSSTRCAGAIDPERGWGLVGRDVAGDGRAAPARARPPVATTSAGSTWATATSAPTCTAPAAWRRAPAWPRSPPSWPGRGASRMTVLPVTDDRVATRIVTRDAGRARASRSTSCASSTTSTVTSVRFDGASSPRPAPGVLDAIGDADVVVIAPSNPIVSIGPVLAVPGVRDAVVARTRPIVAASRRSSAARP